MTGCYFTGFICVLTAIISVQGSCDNCQTCQGDTCYTCSPGYYPASGNCVFCQPNCNNCYDATRCDQCDIGFWSVTIPGSCSACAAGCYSCNSYTDCRICIDGYYLDTGQCVRCPETCIKCFSGGQCRSCVDGYWGSVCSETCPNTCKTNRCTSFIGSCEECNVGWWGPKCKYSCPTHCLNNICSQSETCTDGCKAGFYGSTCSDECPANCKTNDCESDGSCSSGCQAGYYDDTCKQECIGSVCVNKECVQTNGICIASCPDTCSSCSSIFACTACSSGYYGPTCSSECSDTYCLECDKITGECSECGEGSYIDNTVCVQCSENCIPQGQCNQTHGACIDGCEAGWLGAKCDERCNDQCINCSSVIGSCDSCTPGYYGDTCQFDCRANCLEINNVLQCHKTTGACDECKSGYFGDKCESECSNNCVFTNGDLKCNKTTGVCRKCKPGFYGNLCADYCSDGCGKDETGTRMCSKTDGTCSVRCIEGFQGPTCTKALSSGQEPTNTRTIVGVVIGSIGCVALLVIAAVLILRRKQLLCQKSVNREDSNGHGNTENTDPTLSQYEDLRYRPGSDTLYSHLGIDNSTGEENANRPQYENVHESAVNKTKTPGVRQYENVQESAVNETNTPVVRLYENLVL